MKKTLRICFAIPSLRIGGSEKFIIRLIENLGPEFSPVIWQYQGEGELSEQVSKKIQLIKFPANANSLFRVARKLKEYRFDVLDSWSYETPSWTILAGKLAGIPHIVHTRQSLGFWRKPRHFFHAICQRLIVKNIIAISGSIKKDLIANEFFPENRITVFPNFIDATNKQKPAQPGEYKFNKNNFIVGNISVLKTIKNLPTFIEISQYLPSNHHLVIVGGGPLEARLRKLIKNKQLEERITLTGSVTEPERLIPQMDVIVSTSDSEGFGMTILEAWKYKKPVVFTCSGGPEEIITNGVDGLLIPKGNPKLIAKAIIKLSSNQRLREKMGKAGYRKLVDNYNLPEGLRLRKNFYLGLLGSGQ